jgi:hypothetical protein
MSNRTEPRDPKQDHSDRWDNDGRAPANGEHNATTWFVPPVVIPIALVLLIAARVIALAHFGAPAG